ncbi:heterokaryon incompatibility protein-domain-containing protein [Trametes polyzona]|nr:heterokaryon incompatibility protein-domain-containing protein [Trametes polyzona]
MYTVSWAALDSAARTGCVWCTFLVGPARIAKTERLPKSDHRYNIRLGTDSSRSEDAPVIDIYVDNTVPEGCSSLHIWVPADIALHAALRCRPFLSHVRSTRVLDLVKAALDQCTHGVAEHEGCRVKIPIPTSGTFPSRLVDCSNIDRPRLVETNGARPLYVALSYVWGPPSAQPCRTTMANVDEYTLHGLDSKTLPQTIRDAIYVTNALGFQYLWLDSLCIIQDSAEDKHREIARMRDVYRYAYLTIIAASASSAFEGFLQDRPLCPGHLHITDLPVVVPVCKQDGQQQKAQSSTLIAFDSAVYYRKLDEPEPINLRSWCLQELLMSSRSLIYASTTLLYRCSAKTMAIGGAYYGTYGEAPRLPSFISKPAPFPPTSPISTRDVHDSWWDVVKAYSGRALSYPSDKLVAFAGLAEEFGRVRGGPSNYLSGLWRDTLLHDLLWLLDSPAESRAVDYRAPSWSWASLDRAIFSHVSWWEGDTMLAEVVMSAVVLHDERLPYGHVTGGHLVLRVPLILATVTPPYKVDSRRRLPLQTAEQAHLQGGCRNGGPIGHLPYLARAYLDTEEDATVDQIDRSSEEIQGAVRGRPASIQKNRGLLFRSG